MKTLAVKLSKLEKFENVKANLEQYATDSETAASLLWIAFMNGDIEGKVVADFGCGNGILGIGALMLGAKKVYFVDVDKEAINLAKKNNSFDGASFENLDISKFNKKVESVVMNPPFGVQEEHAVRVFLEKATAISNNIYSIHKIESKNFIRSFMKDAGFEIERVEEIKLILGKTMKFHKKEKYVVEVGIWVLKRKL